MIPGESECPGSGDAQRCPSQRFTGFTGLKLHGVPATSPRFPHPFASRWKEGGSARDAR